MIIAILLIQNFFKKKFGLRLKVTDDLIIVCRGDQLFKLLQYMDAAPRVICVLRVLKVLNLHEKVEELIKTLHYININLKQSFKRLLALSILVHGGIVDWISTHNSILLSQDLSISGNNVTSILLK